jgi:acetyl esterase/lipase
MSSKWHHRLQSVATFVLRTALRLVFKSLIGPALPVAWQRHVVNGIALIKKIAPGVTLSRYQIGDLAVESAMPASPVAGKAMLYLHGGAYCLGSPRTHRGLVTHLAAATGLEVVVPDYRLAPEHPFPAAQDDALRCYQALLARGIAAHNISIAGDSAGGGLALSLALRLRDAILPQPGALLLISPWVDLTLSGASFIALQARDPMLNAAWVAQGAQLYAGVTPRDNLGCSPLFAELSGLPAMLIQVGSEEILFDDAQRLAQRARTAGVNTDLQIFQGMWHVFQAHAGMLDVSDAAIERMAEFLRKSWSDYRHDSATIAP